MIKTNQKLNKSRIFLILRMKILILSPHTDDAKLGARVRGLQVFFKPVKKQESKKWKN